MVKTCEEIEKRYEVQFLEIGTDEDHVHFLVQNVPSYSVTKIVTIIKNVTVREIFRQCPVVKKQLWRAELWRKDYFVTTVGQHGTEKMIAKYVQNQGLEEEYTVLKIIN